MSERDNESFDLDDEFRSRLEEVLADRKLEKDLKDFDDDEL